MVHKCTDTWSLFHLVRKLLDTIEMFTSQMIEIGAVFWTLVEAVLYRLYSG